MNNKQAGVMIYENEIGYLAEDAIQLVEHFTNFNIPIVGGDVYEEVSAGKYEPAYAYWWLEKGQEKDEPLHDFVIRANTHTLNYIKNYPHNEITYFVFVWRGFRFL